jgi:hypothetical protein
VAKCGLIFRSGWGSGLLTAGFQLSKNSGTERNSIKVYTLCQLGTIESLC